MFLNTKQEDFELDLAPDLLNDEGEGNGDLEKYLQVTREKKMKDKMKLAA
jgi:hypothetical protein